MLVFQLGYSRVHKRKQLNVEGKENCDKRNGLLARCLSSNVFSGKLSLYILSYQAHLAPGTVLAVDNENP